MVWLVWASYFSVAEWLALKSRHVDAPLSAHCRYVFGMRKGKSQRTLGQMVLGGFLVWLWRHLYSDAHE